jgi:hypothetical protein
MNPQTSSQAGGLSIGGLGLALDRRKLLFWFRAVVAVYVGYVYFTIQVKSFEIFVLLSCLILAAFLPAYLWCAGKVHGLPIVPVFALALFPTYILPLQNNIEILQKYSLDLEAKAILALIGVVVIVTLIWQQMCNDPGWIPKECRMMDLGGSTLLLFAFLILGVLFQLLGTFFGGISGGLFSLLRGYCASGAQLAMFVFAYRLGLGILPNYLKISLFMVVGILIITEAISFILAGTIVRLAVVGAGYALGSQKIPWKSAIVAVGLLAVLHAGKAEMRAAYWKDGTGSQKISLIEYPAVFMEWIGAGIKAGVSGDKKEENDVSSAAERGSMVGTMFRIMDWTPSRKPFLEGATYEGIFSLLVPRILYEKKQIAHLGNWILAYHYEILDLEQLSKTSIAFDLPTEAYANYGFSGMLGLAVVLGLFYGWVGRLSIGVPLLSTRFLFAVLVLSSTLAANNTAGVFVSTVWQSTMALLTVGLLLTKKMPNPLFISSGTNRQNKVPKLVESGRREAERGEKAESDPTSHDASEGFNRNAEAAPVKHERPTRFVYGSRKKES